MDFYHRQAHRRGVGTGRTGTLTVIQRFGGRLNLNVHFHTLALDGVFSEEATGDVHFHPAPPPSDDEVAPLLATMRIRVRRLLRRRGLEGGEKLTPPDPLADESLALAGISSASVLGRIALGRRAGARLYGLWGSRSPDLPDPPTAEADFLECSTIFVGDRRPRAV